MNEKRDERGKEAEGGAPRRNGVYGRKKV